MIAVTNLITVSCAHPRTSELFEAEVSPSCTGNEIILGLVDAGFIDPAVAGRPYQLILDRTKTVVPLNATLEAVGAATGDVISVTQPGQGAGR